MNMKHLVEKLTADLSAPRPLSEQVVRALMDRCEVRSDRIGAFLREEVGAVDEAVVDTVFSPMYTPTWEDRARYVPDRERVAVTARTLDLLVDELVREKVEATYLYEDETVRMRLPEVVVDRWVRRLHLEVTLPEAVREVVEVTVPAGDRSLVKAIAGHGAWRDRDGMLVTVLEGFARTGRFLPDKFEYLTDLVHTYRPADLDQLGRQLDALVRSYQDENDEHFFDNHLKEAYGPDGGTHPVKDSYAVGRQRQRSLATQLLEDLAAFAGAGG